MGSLLLFLAFLCVSVVNMLIGIMAEATRDDLRFCYNDVDCGAIEQEIAELVHYGNYCLLGAILIAVWAMHNLFIVPAHGTPVFRIAFWQDETYAVRTTVAVGVFALCSLYLTLRLSYFLWI